MSFMERVAPVVDETIRALAQTKFVQDPVAGMRYSRATSIVSSAYKRHGRILETALRESLRESNRHKVWQEDAFKVSRAADALFGSQSEDACRQSALPYGDAVRTIQVDMVAFDSADQTIRSYEVKRQWPIRRRQNPFDQARLALCSGFAEELRQRIGQTQRRLC